MKSLLMALSVLCGVVVFGLIEGCHDMRKAATSESSDSEMLKVLQFNIWCEGTYVENGFEKIVNVIIASNADVVTFSEVQNKQGDWHERVLKRLGEKGYKFYGRYAGGDVGLISRYPIERIEPVYDGKGSIRAYYLELPNRKGKPLLVCSAHLDYKNYALYWPRGYNGGEPDFAMFDKNGDGEPDPVMNVEAIQEYNEKSEKDEAVLAFVKYVAEKVPAGTPVILAGDFNDGSHLDWTKRAGGLFDHHGLVIPWKNSVRLQEAGFVDAYRKVYPDELTWPGVTWPSSADGRGTTSWTPKSDERDRIDFIYYKGTALVPEKATLVGPRQYWAKDKEVEAAGNDSFICDRIPWPTDHKGVLIEFRMNK